MNRLPVQARLYKVLLQARLGALFFALAVALSFGWAVWNTPDIPRTLLLSYAALAAAACVYGIFIALSAKRFIPWLGNALTVLAGINITTGLVLNGALAISALPVFIALSLVLGDRKFFLANTGWMLVAAAYVLLWKTMPSELPTATRSFLSSAVIAAIGLVFYRLFEIYLKEQEAQRAELERAQRIARLGSFSMREGTEQFFYSGETARLFGLSDRGECRLEELLSRVHPADRQAVESAWRAALQGAPYDMTYRILVNDQLLWVRALADFTFDTTGQATHFVGSVQDVTETKCLQDEMSAYRLQLEEMVATRTAELQQSMLDLAAISKEQELILDNAAIGITYFKDRTLVWCNQKFCEMMGYEMRDLLGKPAAFFYDAGDDAEHLTSIAKALPILERGESVVFECQGRPRDGRKPWGRISAQSINPAAPLAGLIICVEDIDQQKLMQAKVDALFKQQQAILDNAAVGIMYSRNRVIVWANRKMEAIFGYTAHELQGSSSEMLYSSHADYVQLGEEAQARIRNGEPCLAERQAKRKDGTLIWTRISYQCLDQKNPLNELIVCIEDITEARRHQEQLVRARELAEAGNRAKSEFLANLSHEIRTPLNGILGLAAIIRRSGLTPRQLELLQRLEESGDHLFGILNDILDMTKIEAGKLEMNKSAINIKAITDSLDAIVRERIDSKHLTLAIELEPLPPNLLGDEVRIRQAWLNLLGNAVKFTAQGTITLRASMVGQDASSVLARFEVEDTGIGIAADVLPNLFTEFTQADGSSTRKYGGTGLGLALVRRLAGLMGGEAGASSTPGVGSRFWFTARLDRGEINADETAKAQSAAEVVEALKTEYAGWRVLLVEDEAVNRLVAETLLTDVGLTVDLAENGQEAVDLAKANAYDLILMDMQMPVMDGVSATKEIRQSLGQDMPIIAVTANAFEEQRQECLSAGMNGFLTKPYVEDNLYKTVLRWLAGR